MFAKNYAITLFIWENITTQPLPNLTCVTYYLKRSIKNIKPNFKKKCIAMVFDLCSSMFTSTLKCAIYQFKIICPLQRTTPIVEAGLVQLVL